MSEENYYNLKNKLVSPKAKKLYNSNIPFKPYISDVMYPNENPSRFFRLPLGLRFFCILILGHRLNRYWLPYILESEKILEAVDRFLELQSRACYGFDALNNEQILENIKCMDSLMVDLAGNYTKNPLSPAWLSSRNSLLGVATKSEDSIEFSYSQAEIFLQRYFSDSVKEVLFLEEWWLSCRMRLAFKDIDKEPLEWATNEIY